jgi:3-isopropylmalate/(R)-2-methylmalate dehydratase small subunit
MTPFTQVSGTAYPLGRANVDTDLIIPAAYLKTVRRAGLGRHAFETLRTDPNNIFDDPQFAGSPILVAGANFGCGSSREHAAWALADLGVRAVIASSYSDIFSGNAFKNGIAAVVLDDASVAQLLEAAKQGHTLTVDLDELEVTSSAGDRFGFEMDAFRRECLLGGLDEIALTLASEAAITSYEVRTGI